MNGAVTSSSSSSSKDIQALQGGAGISSALHADKSTAAAAGKVAGKKRIRIRSRLTALRKSATDADKDKDKDKGKEEDKGKDKGEVQSSSSLSPTLFGNIAPNTWISKWFIVEGEEKSWFKGTYVQTFKTCP